MRIVTRTISMNESGTEFSGVVTVEILDPLNNPIASGCSTEVSKRLFLGADTPGPQPQCGPTLELVPQRILIAGR